MQHTWIYCKGCSSLLWAHEYTGCCVDIWCRCADAQVVHHALSSRLIHINGDSDLLAIGWLCRHGASDLYCMIDLTPIYTSCMDVSSYNYTWMQRMWFIQKESGFPIIEFAKCILLMGKIVVTPSAVSFVTVAVWYQCIKKRKHKASVYFIKGGC